MKPSNLSKKKTAFILGGCAALIPLLYLIYVNMPQNTGDGNEAQPSISQPIPEADIEQGPEGKTDSYVRSGISDYWDSLEEQSGRSEDGDGSDIGAITPGRGGRRPGTVCVDDIFGDVKGDEQQIPEPPARKGTGSGTSRRKDEQQRSESAAADTQAQPVEEAAPSRIQVKKSGAISSLDDDIVQDLGSGISTLDGKDMWVQGESGKPYRCMFTRDEKVSSGQRISLRLLEDLVIDGVHIPQNTHLQGVCAISDRMEVSITSLDMGGRILSFHFEAYDTDGGKGIYCYDLSKTRKEVTNQGISTAMAGLNSKLGSAARDAASLGASVMRSKTGEATVTVPAGYTFYIVEEKRF